MDFECMHYERRYAVSHNTAATRRSSCWSLSRVHQRLQRTRTSAKSTPSAQYGRASRRDERTGTPLFRGMTPDV